MRDWPCCCCCCCCLRLVFSLLLLLVLERRGSNTLAQWNPGSVVVMSDEKRLIKHLLLQYETIGIVGRPVYNISETVKVFYGLALIQLLDLDEKNQVLTTNVWSRYNWNDILLTWDPLEYGGVDHVRVPVSKIWTPDIVLYNYADTRLKEQRETMAVISNEGLVLWIPPAIFKSTCSIDITHFPFDEQLCHLKFGSWTYDGYKLDILFFEGLEQVDVRDYVDSNEWALVEYPARKNIRYYSCCSDLPFPDLTFSLRLKRIAIFYNYVLILPCVLLSFLTLVIFWLPPESPAKMMLGMNIFVAFFVLLLLLADNTPPAASTIPLIGAYFCMNMILITLSTFLAVIVIQTHIRSDRRNRVPDWLKRLTIEGLARVLCMDEAVDLLPVRSRDRQGAPAAVATPTQCPDTDPVLRPSTGSSFSSSFRRQTFSEEMCSFRSEHLNLPNRDTLSSSRQPSSTYHLSRQQPPNPPPASDPLFQGHARPFVANNGCCDKRLPGETVVRGNRVCDVSDSDQVLESDVKEIKRILRSYMVRLSDKDYNARVAKEWRVVARVLDRLFFFMYVSTIIVSLATIFPRGG